uniref:Uncharacterized protein n=1 Tax=Romanomermis culicivorax TaxID=13658 RepID=A0A915JM28_ROMCU
MIEHGRQNSRIEAAWITLVPRFKVQSWSIRDLGDNYPDRGCERLARCLKMGARRKERQLNIDRSMGTGKYRYSRAKINFRYGQFMLLKKIYLVFARILLLHEQLLTFKLNDDGCNGAKNRRQLLVNSTISRESLAGFKTYISKRPIIGSKCLDDGFTTVDNGCGFKFSAFKLVAIICDWSSNETTYGGCCAGDDGDGLWLIFNRKCFEMSWIFRPKRKYYIH